MKPDYTNTIRQLNKLLAKVTALDRTRNKLVNEIIELFPIKAGEKVSVISGETKAHVRYAFVEKICIDEFNEVRETRISFKLNKCTATGKRSYQNDYLSKATGEYITKIK